MKTIVLRLMFAALLGLGLISAGCEKPGEGEKAERGYQVCQPIIDALADYHADTGAYPENLDALAPKYLADIPPEVNGYPIRYTLTPTSYTLGFSYERPGMNHCDYAPETGWECYGYY
jgi:hypothetical protein